MRCVSESVPLWLTFSIGGTLLVIFALTHLGGSMSSEYVRGIVGIVFLVLTFGPFAVRETAKK